MQAPWDASLAWPDECYVATYACGIAGKMATRNVLQSDVWKKQGIVVLDSARSWDGIRRQGIPNKCKGFFSQLLCSMTSSLLGPDEVDRELIKIF